MRRFALCFALAATTCPAQTVRIGVFGLFHPAELRLAAVHGGALEVHAGAMSFVLRDGEAATVQVTRHPGYRQFFVRPSNKTTGSRFTSST